MSKELKKPLTQEELETIFDTGSLPAFMTNRPSYIVQDIRNFYIGINKSEKVDILFNKGYKYYVKKLIAINNSVRLPYRRNKLIRNWGVKKFNSNNPVVIIVDVEEIDFSMDKNNTAEYNLIGIYSIKDFQKEIYKYFSNQTVSDYTFKEFSVFLEEGEEDNIDYISQLAKLNSHKKTVNRVSIVNTPAESIEPVNGSSDNDLKDVIDNECDDYISKLLNNKDEALIDQTIIDTKVDEPEDDVKELNELYEDDIIPENKEKIYKKNLDLMESEFGESAIDENIKYNEKLRTEQINDIINEAVIDDSEINDNFNTDNKYKIQNDKEYFGLV